MAIYVEKNNGLLYNRNNLFIKMEEYGLMDFLTLATSVVPDRSLGFTLTVIIAGLGIVLGTLAILIVIFRLFGAIMEASQKSSQKKAQKKAEAQKKDVIPAPVIPAQLPTPVVEDGINPEVVAAISAAVYTMENGKNVTISSITRKNPITGRNPWAQAAVIDNTRPF